MKKVVMILLSVTMLLVSCAKQTTITTEQADSHTESLTEPTENNTDIPTEETNEMTETTEITEPLSEDPTDYVDDPELSEGEIRIIGEYATVEEAFAGYELVYPTYNDDGRAIFKVSKGEKVAVYAGENTNCGYLVECREPKDPQAAALFLVQVYAFGKLYDYSGFYCPLDSECGEPFGTEQYVSATEEMLTVNIFSSGYERWFKCYYPGGEVDFQDVDQITDNQYSYCAYIQDGVMRYKKARGMIMRQELFGWSANWYPGLCEEHGAEVGRITIVGGKVELVPDEVYTVGDIVLYLWPNFKNSTWAFYDEFIASGCETVDEFVGKYFTTNEGIRELFELK